MDNDLSQIGGHVAQDSGRDFESSYLFGDVSERGVGDHALIDLDPHCRVVQDVIPTRIYFSETVKVGRKIVPFFFGYVSDLMQPLEMAARLVDSHPREKRPRRWRRHLRVVLENEEGSEFYLREHCDETSKCAMERLDAFTALVFGSRAVDETRFGFPHG